ncbi:MAG: molybdate transport system ATP-binding protein [Frankiaceae bacterium]|nr:molybdate transport system ATP-binding protein [Frankiaceae bacterium]
MSLEARVYVERGDFVLDVALTVADGEVVAVLGPNGAGKTTLLRTIAGLLPLTSGQVVLGGTTLDDPAGGVRRGPNERGIGVVFQDYRLFPHLSAADNVAFGPRSAGVPRAAARRQAKDWLARVGLAGLGDRKPAELSGGQAQRVALARALILTPALLLLDEPLAALDASTRAEVRGELRRLLDDFRGPAVFVTHDALDAMTLATRVVILEAGRVVQQGAPQEIAQRPATSYVAQLVGLSLLRGVAAAGVLLLADGTRVTTADTALNGAALAVVRPSSVVVATEAPSHSSVRNSWQRAVSGLQPLGDRVRVSFAGPPAVVADITNAAVAEMRLGVGDVVWVSVKATDITTYPDTSGPPIGAQM